MHFSIPVTVVHYDPGSSQNIKLTVEFPKYNFSLTKELVVNAVGSTTDAIHTPLACVEFDTFTSKDPQKMIITCELSDEWTDCIVFRPVIKNIKDITPVVQTISLKKNGIEIATDIDNLHPAYNFKSWVNVWMKNKDTVVYRYFCDTLLTKDAYLAKNL
jgi:hypothetical protein